MNEPNADFEFASLKPEDIQKIMDLESKISSGSGGGTILLAYNKKEK